MGSTDLSLERNVDLKKYNTFGVAANAKFYTRVTSVTQAKSAVEFARSSGLSVLVLGGGSNLLFVSQEVDFVLHLGQGEISLVREDADTVDVQVDSGVVWDDFVRWTVENSLYGLENLSYIPGKVGASPVQNIGAYGVEVAERLLGVYLYDFCKNEYYFLPAQKCEFGYRTSIFKTKLKGCALILSVSFRLSKKPVFNLSYKALKEQFQVSGQTQKELRELIGKIRASKLPSPQVLGNAGSFFKNPIVHKSVLSRLEQVYQVPVPFYPHGDEFVKIPAGWLIDRTGLKGFRMGNVGVYPKNALVIVNYGGASGKEISEFAHYIQKRVEEKSGISLQPEVNFV